MQVSNWFRDRAVRKVVKHGIPVALAKVAAAGSGLVTLAILARYLGPGPFGVIALYRTVVMMVDLFANFNTWQAVIKYGTEAIANKQRENVERVIKLAFVIDATTAILGTLVVAALAFIIPGNFGWSHSDSILCTVYALILITKVAGTSDGIFRICDAYRVQGIVGSVMAVVMTAIVAIAVAVGASFAGCVLALIAGEVLSNLAITITSFWVAKRSGYGDWYRSSLAGVGKIFPGIRHFLVATNAQLTVRTAQSELDMIVVGSALGKASAGLFRVIKQLGTIPGRIFNPFETVLFTELARSSAERDYSGFARLLRRSVVIAGAGSFVVWAIAAIFATQLIHVVAGDAFIAAVPAFRIYLFAMVLQVMGAPILRAMIALGRPGTLFMFDSAALVVLATATIVGAYTWGLLGVAAAIVLHKALQVSWSALFVWRFLRTNVKHPAH